VDRRPVSKPSADPISASVDDGVNAAARLTLRETITIACVKPIPVAMTPGHRHRCAG
jgi:hypothetical protein